MTGGRAPLSDCDPDLNLKIWWQHVTYKLEFLFISSLNIIPIVLLESATKVRHCPVSGRAGAGVSLQLQGGIFALQCRAPSPTPFTVFLNSNLVKYCTTNARLDDLKYSAYRL